MFKCYLLGSQLLGGYWLSFLFAKVYNLCVKVVYNLTKKIVEKNMNNMMLWKFIQNKLSNNYLN